MKPNCSAGVQLGSLAATLSPRGYSSRLRASDGTPPSLVRLLSGETGAASLLDPTDTALAAIQFLHNSLNDIKTSERNDKVSREGEGGHVMMPAADQLVHTYSIVARDPDTGLLGVAVQSHYFAAGSVVTWAEAGVGAVASQASADPAYGKLGLDLMRARKSAPDTLAGLLAADPMREIRQVAMVDALGRVAAHTGQTTIPEAGHIVGDGFSVQANMMLKNTVWAAMAEAYTGASGQLVDRFLAALDAAEADGGDIRGRQTAAILIVEGKSRGRPGVDTIFDLRVDDAPEPLVEIRRLVAVRRAYIHMRLGNEAAQRTDLEGTGRELTAARRPVG